MLNVDLRRSGKKGIKGIIVSYNEQSCLFNGHGKVQLEYVEKGSTEPENNLYDCFNEYITSVLTPEKQLRLFKLFEKAHNIVENGKFYDYHEELGRLNPITDDIIEMVGVEKYCGFIQNSRHLKIPKGLSEAASKGDFPVETTITDNDYVNLVKLAFVVRIIHPIVFGLLHRLNERMGVGYSGVVAGQLIKDNFYIKRMFGWEKLKTYFEFSFSKKPTPTQIDGGGNTESFVEKVLFSAVFDRLCCAVIPETERDKNIANTINGAVRQHESSVSFRSKEDRGGGSDTEDKRSTYDQYNITEKVKASDIEGETEYFSFGLFDENEKPRYVDRFKHQCIGLGIKNEKLVEKVFDNLPPNWDFELNDVNQQLISLVFSSAVSPFIWDECEYIQIMAALALGQVKLAELGYTYLPSLLGIVHDPEGVRTLAEGLKLTNENKNYLASICDVQSRNSENRGYNEVLLAVDRFFTELTNKAWKSNLEYGVLDDPKIYDRVSTGSLFSIEVENEIRVEFMDLIQKVNS